MRSLVLALCVVASVTAVDPPTPARYLAGPVPPLLVRAVGGGQLFLEVSVGSRGVVDTVTPLRTTPPSTEPLVGAVGAWRFQPAEELPPTGGRRGVASKVLVVAVYRPPSLLEGPTVGDAPQDVASASDETPFPIVHPAPKYPVNALGDGVVLLEVRVEPSGAVTDARVVQSARSFDGPALDAARQWTFRPARLHGRPVATLAYLIFGFRQPVT
jgi:TonB family protein